MSSLRQRAEEFRAALDRYMAELRRLPEALRRGHECRVATLWGMTRAQHRDQPVIPLQPLLRAR
ncbi:hypothetical protein ACVDG5_032390 [Mesorhizobium sp. ORM6]